ncbi:MAG: class I SAM-dependent methyltransferase [Clostridium sp.]
MITNWEQEWDKIYKEQGEVQFGVLKTALIASEIFKNNELKNILDLGCGTGRHSIYLALQGFNVYASDVSQKAIQITQEKANELNITNIKYKQHDMRDIDFKSEFFDGILCVWTTGHGNLDDATKNVNEIYRVLKPNGIVVIDYISTEDINYGKGEEIEKDTFLNNVEGEENIPHHYSTREEIENLYSSFSFVEINPIEYNFFDKNNNEHTIKAFAVVAQK